MHANGWLFMGLSWGGILALFGFCLYRTLRSRGSSSKQE